MSRRVRLESKFPEKNLTQTTFADNLDCLYLDTRRGKNKHGGEHINVYFNDGKSNNRVTTVEMELFSSFGVSELVDKDGKSKWSIGFPVRENPELEELVPKFNEAMVDKVYEKRDVCFNDTEMIDKRFLNKIFKGLSRKPQNPDVLEKWGESMKAGITDNTKFYKTTGEVDAAGKPEIVECKRSEIVRKKGSYLVTLAFPRVFLKDMGCGIVVSAYAVCYQDQGVEEDGPFSNCTLKRKAMSPPPVEAAEPVPPVVESETSTTPVVTAEAEVADASSSTTSELEEPGKKPKIE